MDSGVPDEAIRDYAGVGARKTPVLVQARMEAIAAAFARRRWTLRTGGQRLGADDAFLRGHRSVAAASRPLLYLPKRGFGGHHDGFVAVTDKLIAEARRHHPDWTKLDEFGQQAMARNVAIVLGLEMSRPVPLVICWTPRGKPVGGTSHAMRVAAFYNIPVFNLGDPDYRVEPLRELVASIENAPAPHDAAARSGTATALPSQPISV